MQPKKSLAVFLILFPLITCKSYSQNNQVGDDPFMYKVNGNILLKEFITKDASMDSTFYVAGKYGYDLVGEFIDFSSADKTKYLKLQLTPFEYKFFIKDSTINNVVYSIMANKPLGHKKTKRELYKKTDAIIDVPDQGRIFLIKDTDFNSMIEKKFIRKRYYNRFSASYGASLTVPFKIRPEIEERNMKITPELSLGGYFGLKKRINYYENHFWHIAVVTFGVTTIGINKDNVIQEVATDEIKDGLVFARTVSFGSVLQFNDFQLGLICGFDKAGGEIGRDWIYNDKFWYSLSVGFSILNANKKDK